MERKAAFSENRASADAEMLSAIAATVGHRLLVFDGSNIGAAAVTAMRLVAPAVALEIRDRRFLIREASEELINADGLWFVGHET